MSDEKCARCDGCGRVASTEDGEPWTAWASLPPGSDLAVRLGVVKPLRCPRCDGTGLVRDARP
jgi:hypothetical protein